VQARIATRCRGHRALGLAHPPQDRHERSLFTNQSLRETEVEIDPERIERLRRGNAEAYQRYASEIHPLPGLGARCSNCSNSIQHELNRVRREQDPKQPGENSIACHAQGSGD
jgi:hypothetical protein